MNEEQRQQLRELVRTEPNLRATFDELTRERDEALDHVVALQAKHRELRCKLAAIDDAKASLAASAPAVDATDGSTGGEGEVTHEEDASGGPGAPAGDAPAGASETNASEGETPA